MVRQPRKCWNTRLVKHRRLGVCPGGAELARWLCKSINGTDSNTHQTDFLPCYLGKVSIKKTSLFMEPGYERRKNIFPTHETLQNCVNSQNVIGFLLKPSNFNLSTL